MLHNRKPPKKPEVATLLAVLAAMEQTDRPYVLQSEISAIRQASRMSLSRHIGQLETMGFIRRTIEPGVQGRPWVYEIIDKEALYAWLAEYLATEESKPPSQAYRSAVDKVIDSLLDLLSRSDPLIKKLREEICQAF